MVQASTIRKLITYTPRQKIPIKRFLEEKPLKKETLLLKQLFSKEKMNIIYTIKNKKPSSVYELSRMLNKDFKSVYQNVIFLKDYGIISLQKIKQGNRISLQPTIIAKKIEVSILI